MESRNSQLAIRNSQKEEWRGKFLPKKSGLV